jgi:LysM repeat protein
LLLAALLGGCARREEPRPGTVAPAGQGTIAPLPAVTRAAPTLTPAEVAGIADVGSLPEPTPPPQVYVVQAGDTLSGIARQFGCDVEALVQANNLINPNSLQIGQVLQVPSTQIETGPAISLLPNSEFVYGPAYVDFDTAAFVAREGGYLNSYRETVGGELLSGPEIVDLVAHHYSVGPRLLLAILEMRGGWVTDPDPSGAALSHPMGYQGGGWDLLSRQLAWAADELNRGYYDWRGRGVEFITWGDGTASRYAPTLNAATAGLQYFFSLDASRAEWTAQVGQGAGSFLATYRRLFGDPAQYAVEPLVPNDTVCPELALPWAEGELWYYTGGPHGGWNEGSAWSALDFVPDEGYLGCQPATAWATAAAPGLVIYSRDGEVLVDLDGDGHEQTGWVLFYLHVATEGRVTEGTRVQSGDPIGHPSCEGGFSESTHLHLARRFNGEWMAADGPVPMVLSGWRFASAGVEYEGSASRGGEERTACECRDAEFNGLLADR